MSVPANITARSILMTGCSSGIGYACAHTMQKRGHRVFATTRQATDVERLRAEGLTALRLDYTDSESIVTCVEQVLEQTDGQLYALFNNGAYGQGGGLEDISRTVLREQLETNLLGWHELTCRVLPSMHAHGTGRIVQNSSVLGLVALPLRGAYNCSKFALEGWSDTLRMELAGSGIAVSLIEPGPIATRFRENSHARFLATIDVDNSPHRQRYQGAINRLASRQPTPFTLPAAAVVRKVIHAIESEHPRARYYVTFPTYLFATLRRLLPTTMLDKVLLAIARAENR